MSAVPWLDEFDAALREHAANADGSGEQAEALVALALAAGREVTVPEDELRGAARRALLVLAAGGDPNRGLELGGRAVETVADDLDSPFRRDALTRGLVDLRAQAGDREAVGELLDTMVADGELAWRAFSAARMIEMIGEDERAEAQA